MAQTVLVAIVVDTATRETAVAYVDNLVGGLNLVEEYPSVDCWWLAEDDRPDPHEDTDSAVFIDRGYQKIAATLLHRHGLGSDNNIPKS